MCEGEIPEYTIVGTVETKQKKKSMYIIESSRTERIVRIVLYVLFAILVGSVVFSSVLPLGKIEQSAPGGIPKSGETGSGTSLQPMEERKLQEEVAPLIDAGDMNACDRIQNDLYRKVCVDNIALNKASGTGDIRFCQYLDDKLVTKASCEWQVLGKKSIDKEDRGVCDETGIDSVRKDCEGAFSFGMAGKKHDPKLCDQDADKTNVDLCWTMYQARVALLTSAADGTTGMLDCTLFRGDAAKADCATLAPALKTADQAKIGAACQNLKTGLFGEVCMLPGKFGTMPVPSAPSVNR